MINKYLGFLAVIAAMPFVVNAAGPKNCATIQGGTIVDTTGNPVTVGTDEFGYNYQAHSFNGTYDSSDRTIDGTYWGSTGDYVDDKLMMKWSDEWLSNLDCDGDHKLDRGLVNGTVNGVSMGWLTNHLVGDYESPDGTQNYTDFVKIVWTGTGPLWGAYTLVQEVYNDPYGGFNGLMTKEGTPGLGLMDHWTTL